MARILVVEDEEMLRVNLVEELEDSDYDVIEAFDGQDGLEKAIEHQPDLIISDVSMPRMTGLEFCEELNKQDGTVSAIPFIFLTAHGDRDSQIKGRKMGASDYLTKPVDYDLLLAAVEAQLASSRKIAGAVEAKYKPLLDKVRSHTELKDFDSSDLKPLLEAYDQAAQMMADYSSGCAHLVSVRYRFRTLEECREVALQVAQICPEPEIVLLGVRELLVNAVEHGNLGVSYDDKSDLLDSGDWDAEIERRLKSAEYSAKRVNVAVKKLDDRIEILIKDDGDGFDWQKYEDIDPKRLLDKHGRGIALSRMMSFDELSYKGNGNTVKAVIKLSANEKAETIAA